jgi:LemA protein
MEWVMLVLLGVVVALIAYGVMIYNRLVGLRNSSEGAWADIDVQLKRRYDLVDNLVETVKGYAAHERQTLDQVIKARQAGVAAGTVQQQAQAENMLTAALRQLFALAEAYPNLKANENFLSLQQSLTDLEEAIQNARRYYNAVVRDLNTRIESFPDMFFAGPFGFKKRDYFELEEPEARKAPQVRF